MDKPLTQKQEDFVNNLFQRMTQRDAWIGAGYSSNYPVAIIDQNACRMAGRSKIKARLEEMRQAAKSALVGDEVERKERLTEIYRARLTDYITCGPDRDMIDVGPESPNPGAISEITSRTEFNEDGAGVAVITKLKLHNPIPAIAEQNKMEHLYETNGITQNINVVFVIGKGYRGLPQLVEGGNGNGE